MSFQIVELELDDQDNIVPPQGAASPLLRTGGSRTQNGKCCQVSSRIRVRSCTTLLVGSRHEWSSLSFHRGAHLERSEAGAWPDRSGHELLAILDASSCSRSGWFACRFLLNPVGGRVP